MHIGYNRSIIHIIIDAHIERTCKTVAEIKCKLSPLLVFGVLVVGRDGFALLVRFTFLPKIVGTLPSAPFSSKIYATVFIYRLFHI